MGKIIHSPKTSLHKFDPLSLRQWFVTFFCLIYPSIKSQNRFYPQQCLVCQGMTSLERVRGRFSRKTYIQIHEFCAYWNQFLGKAYTKLISLWDETLIKCSYKKTLLLVVRRGSLILLKSGISIPGVFDIPDWMSKNSPIPTDISVNQEAKCLEEGIHSHVQIFLLLKNDVVNVWLPCPWHVVAPAILQSLIVPLCSPRGCCVVLAVSECNTAKCSFSAVCPPWEAFDQLRCCVCFRVSLLACSAPWLSGVLSELKSGFLQIVSV